MLMRKATFQQRLENLAERVRKHRVVELVKDMPPYLDQVLLHCNGFIESNGSKVDLKAAKKTGTLWLGTESHSLGYNKQSISPYQVVVSAYKPGRLGPHKQSITFIPVEEEVDVTHFLISWLGDGQNALC